MPKHSVGTLRHIANLGSCAIKRIQQSFTRSKSSDKENAGSQAAFASKCVIAGLENHSSLAMHNVNKRDGLHTLHHDHYATLLPRNSRPSFPPDPMTPASVSLLSDVFPTAS